MNKPHVHAEFIKAWADGAQIQVFYTKNKEWVDCTEPFWSEKEQYRIKPQNLSATYIVDHKYSVREPEHWEKPNLALTFDGETGKLKTAEVL